MRKQKKNVKNETKPKRYRTRVSCVECSNCGDIIYSRAHHDQHSCRCGATFVDGGFEYFRRGFDPKLASPPVYIVKYVNASKQTLYDDWNYTINEYGIVGVKGWKNRDLKGTK